MNLTEFAPSEELKNKINLVRQALSVPQWHLVISVLTQLIDEVVEYAAQFGRTSRTQSYAAMQVRDALLVVKGRIQGVYIQEEEDAPH